MKRVLKFLVLAFSLVGLVMLASCGATDKVGEIVDSIGGGGGSQQDTKDYTLTNPTNFKYDGTTISWDAVKNATGYTISVNNGEEKTVTSPMYRYNAQNTDFTIKVTAKNEKNTTEASYQFYALGQVTALNVSDDGEITWDSVQYATGYQLVIDGKDSDVILTSESYTPTTVGTHNYAVRPVVVGDNQYYASTSANKKLTLLGAVDSTKISYSEGYINFPYVTGAVKYQVMVNGVKLDQEPTTTKIAYEPNNTDFEVSVIAIGDHKTVFDGAESEAKKFIFLDTATNVKVINGIVVWDPVDKATGYKIKLNGRELSQTLSECKYEGITEAVATTVEIKAVANNADILSSYCSAVNVFLLPAPIIQWNDDFTTGSSAVQAMTWSWQVTQEISGFNMKIVDPDGVENVVALPGTARGYTNDFVKAGNYQFQLQATSGETDVYDSKYSRTFTVKRLENTSKADNNFVVSTLDDLTKGFTVTFKAIGSASKYELWKDSTYITYTTTNQFSVKDFYDTESMDKQEINFQVRVIGANKADGNMVIIDAKPDEALQFKITILAAPQVKKTDGFGMDGYDYTFGAVSGNNGYRVFCGAQKFDVSTNKCSLSTIEPGSYLVSVCTKGDGALVLPSQRTASLNLTRLEAPTNIRIDTSDASEGVLTYDAVLMATGYTVTFNNDGVAVPADTISNINQYITTQGTTVFMMSTGNYYNTDFTQYYMTSKPSATVNFIKLATPTFGEAPFTNTELLWNAPSNINSNIYTPTYIVYLEDGTVLNGERNGTRMDITTLEGGNQYTFRVKAVGNGTTYINSEISTTVTIYKLRTPNVKVSKTCYEWKSVASAVSYNVYVNDKLQQTDIHVSGDTYSYTPDKFTEIGYYNVKVVAVGDAGYTTINSDACEIRTQTKQLDTPDFSFKYSTDHYDENGTIDLTITKESPNAKGYTYTVADTTYASMESTYSHNPHTVGTFSLRVYANGGNFDEDGVYYLDSQSVGGNSSYQLTILASPNASSVLLSADGVVTWTTITGARNYTIKVYIDDVLVKTETTSSARYEIVDYEKGHTYRVEIVANGNGTTVITGAPVEKDWTVNA